MLAAVTIESIVWFVFGALIVIAILGLLWWGIGYAEANMPGFPMAFRILRVVFVLLVIFLLICILLALIGHPIIDFGGGGGGPRH